MERGNLGLHRGDGSECHQLHRFIAHLWDHLLLRCYRLQHCRRIGRSAQPALAKKLRQRLEQTIGPEYAKFLRALRLLRKQAKQAVHDPKKRQAIYRRAVESNLFEAAARGDAASVASEIDALVKLGLPASPRT